MARILEFNGPFYAFSRLVNESKDFVFLISPYIRFSNSQLKELKAAVNRGVEITIVFRSPKREEVLNGALLFIDDINGLKNLKIISCPGLHAKLYINEIRAILTSKNLYERQHGRSRDIGVRFNEISDKRMYNSLLSYAKDIAEYDDCEVIVDNTKTETT